MPNYLPHQKVSKEKPQILCKSRHGKKMVRAKLTGRPGAA